MFPRSNKKNTEELLNLSRVEQIRWHPDKFQVRSKHYLFTILQQNHFMIHFSHFHSKNFVTELIPRIETKLQLK